jgi:hypothetical protein
LGGLIATRTERDRSEDTAQAVVATILSTRIAVIADPDTIGTLSVHTRRGEAGTLIGTIRARGAAQPDLVCAARIQIVNTAVGYGIAVANCAGIAVVADDGRNLTLPVGAGRYGARNRHGAVLIHITGLALVRIYIRYATKVTVTGDIITPRSIIKLVVALDLSTI